MPSYRRYRRRTFNKRKPKSWYNRRYSVSASPLQVAKTALRGVNYIRGLVNSEMYKFDIASSNAVSNSGTIIHLTGVDQGDQDFNRTGNSILAKSVLMKLAINQNVAAVNTLYRIIFFQDLQQIGDTFPSVADLLDTTSTLAPISSNTVGRFKILKNYFFHTSNARDTVKEITCYIPLNTHIRYNGVTGGDIQKGGIYMLMLSDQGVSTPTIFWNHRLSYHDN